jgi:2-keto-4-pentenoate hydratase/2-oxohepta-3-ene-1,7-dioic acid hydratase in catechol pathway
MKLVRYSSPDDSEKFGLYSDGRAYDISSSYTGFAGMIFDVPSIIEHAPSRVTLDPGDIISTGTPAGVGVARNRTLAKGDVIRVQAEGIGYLENRVV